MPVSYDDVLFPEKISYGSSGGPGYLTETLQLPSGHRNNVSRWSQPLWQYNIAYGVRTHHDLSLLRNFYLARRGAARAFRYKDFTDCNTTLAGVDPNFDDGQLVESFEGVPEGEPPVEVPLYDQPTFTDQPVLPVPGSATQFYLVRSYSSGPSALFRRIHAPRIATVRITLDGTAESTAGWMINSEGVLTFDAAPANPGEIRWGGEYDHIVQFGAGSDRLLRLSLDSFGDGSAENIELIDVRPEAGLIPGGFYSGGAFERAIEASHTLSYAEGMFQLIDAVGGQTLLMPDPTDLPLGRGPTLAAAGGSSSISIRDHNGNTLGSLSSGNATTVFLYEDGAGNRLWAIMGI